MREEKKVVRALERQLIGNYPLRISVYTYKISYVGGLGNKGLAS